MAGIALQTLEHITLFQLNCSLFHGNRKLSAADLKSALNVDIDTDTSKAVMALGVKRVFDKKELSKLTAVKREMHTECGLVGTPFLGGYAVPNDKATKLSKKLDDLKAKGMGLKADLLARYDDVLEKYAVNNPDWEKIIKAGAFNASYVDSQIGFDWNGVGINPGDNNGLMAQNLSTKVGGLPGDLLNDIAKEAKLVSENSLNGKSGVTRRAFAPLLRMADKLEGFIFMDTRVGRLGEMIRHVLLVMPHEGRIEGENLRNLVSLTSILENPDKALKLAQEVEDTNVLDTFDSVFGTNVAKNLPVAVEPPPALLAPEPVTAQASHGALDAGTGQSVGLANTAIGFNQITAPPVIKDDYVINRSPDNNPFGF